MTDDRGPTTWLSSLIHSIASFTSRARGRSPATAALITQTEILMAVTDSLAAYVDRGDWKEAFGRLLRCALSLTDSEYGFVGVVVNGPELRVLAHEGIVWDDVVNREFYDQTLRHYQEHGYLSFRNFNNLFGRAIVSGQVVVANSPDQDPRAVGPPAGHPAMRSFLGVPILAAGQVTGLIALANRPRGYGQEESHRIEALVRQAGGMCDGYRHRERARVAADERRKAEAARRASDERLRLVARATSDAVWDWNLDTGTVFMPEGFEKLFGTAGEPREMDVTDWYRRIHPDDLERVVGSLQGAINGGAEVWSGEYRFRRPGGSYASVFDRGYVLRDERGHPLRMIGAMMDVTERKQLEEQFRQSQKLEAIGQLAGGVAHDFNNILTVIHAHASLLLAGGQPEPVSASLHQIADAAERAAGLTRQLLAFSRKQVLQTVDFDFNESVVRMTRLFDRILGEDIALTAQLSSEPAFVRADASMMEQVLLNLVVNARDAMPRGGRLTLRTTVERLGAETLPDHVDARPGTFVRLTVIDTGSGISADVLAHVFEPFFTTKNIERATGLGLATVYGVVKQHDGWITVCSVVDAGTTFDVYLPAVAAPAKNDSAAVVVPERAVSRGGETILLVEDDEAVRQLARLLLERRNYRVLEAGSGPSALARYREHQAPIDLVLTDLVLPGGLSGLELVNELRKAGSDLKVLLTSGYSVDIAGKELALVGHTQFLPKPYTATQLTAAVRDCLDEIGDGTATR